MLQVFAAIFHCFLICSSLITRKVNITSCIFLAGIFFCYILLTENLCSFICSFPSVVYCFLFSHIHFSSLPLPSLLDFHSHFHDHHTQMNTEPVRARWWFPTSSRGNTHSVENVTNAKQILEGLSYKGSPSIHQIYITNYTMPYSSFKNLFSETFCVLGQDCHSWFFPLINCTPLGKLLYLKEPQFPHL